MSARSQLNASAALPLEVIGGEEVSTLAARPRTAPSVAGKAASAQSLQRMTDALAQLKSLSIQPMLQKAAAAIRRDDHATASQWALAALQQDERCGMAWYCLAIAREQAADFKGSVQCYEKALLLAPEHDEIANNLGRLAYRMGMRDIAEQLFLTYLAAHPGAPDASNNLACIQRDKHRYGEAVATLTPIIQADPENPLLWNTLGTILTDQGDYEGAFTFYDEALRLDGDFTKARYNRSTAKLHVGDAEGALEDCEAALEGPCSSHERAMMTLAKGTMLVALGRLKDGWAAYEARLDHHYPDSVKFLINRPLWQPGDKLKGKTLFLSGEQGLGDEVLFANIVPDLIERLGPKGKLILAVEPRLAPLFERAFPKAWIGAHATYSVDGRTVRCFPFLEEPGQVDLWSPMASLLRDLRPTVDSYPDRPAFLAADPARVAHWRRVLEEAPAGAKVGILWKSLKLEGSRLRYFSPFEAWRAVLTTPGITFVNLQYGDSAAEIEWARQNLGVEIWTPPGIDLKQDLDDVAALCLALDLVLAPANATSNIAAACGAKAWLISTQGAWPKLGTERYPWYPTMRVFTPPGSRRWEAVMDEIAAALSTEFPR